MESHNQETGKKGEDIASEYLLKNGFAIEQRNWRFRHYEVDIIASQNKFLHFIEVKTRTNLRFGHPEESISKEKMQHLKNAASAYQGMNPRWKYIQFDVIAITLENGLVKELFCFNDVYF